MATDHSEYKEQPEDPNRKPENSVTWVRNLDKHLKTERVQVIVQKPAFRPKKVGS